MSATMARQGGRVELEQSDMRLSLNMAKMAKEGFSHTIMEEIKYLIKTPHAEIREEKKWDVEFPGHIQLKAGKHIHPAMPVQNQTSGGLPCQNGTAMNPHTPCTRKQPGAPPPDRRRERTPEATPLLPRMPLAPTGNTSRDQPSQIVNLPAGYRYSHTAPLFAEFFDGDDDTQHNAAFDPHMLTNEDLYTLCGVVMQLIFFLKTGAAE
jgi:hypothetical protein